MKTSQKSVVRRMLGCVAGMGAAGALLFAVSTQAQNPASPAPPPPATPPAASPQGAPGGNWPTPAVATNVAQTEAKHPLVWDAMTKEYQAKFGEITNRFVFYVTNTSPTEVVSLDRLQPSCGCTTAGMPSVPWKLKPGESGPISAVLNFAGKRGLVTKAVTVMTSHGTQILYVKVNAPEPPAGLSEREHNQVIAKADRQAVFRGECGTCHSHPGYGKLGPVLYEAVCAICHEAKQQAQMVPDLRTNKYPADIKFWENIIANGREGTLMPAFNKLKGGPLMDEQIGNLAEFLAEKFSKDPVPHPPASEKKEEAHPAPAPAPPAPAAPSAPAAPAAPAVTPQAATAPVPPSVSSAATPNARPPRTLPVRHLAPPSPPPAPPAPPFQGNAKPK